MISEYASFVGTCAETKRTTVTAGGVEYTADHVVIAVGGAPDSLAVPGGVRQYIFQFLMFLGTCVEL